MLERLNILLFRMFLYGHLIGLAKENVLNSIY